VIWLCSGCNLGSGNRAGEYTPRGLKRWEAGLSQKGNLLNQLARLDLQVAVDHRDAQFISGDIQR
jgi:hypothetical protein